MIKIKAWFGDWKTVSREKALSFAKSMYRHIIAVPKEQKVEYINKKHLRGVKFTEEEIKSD